MTFRKGVSGNPHGNRHHTRHLLNQRFLQALLLDFDAHGREAIEECRKQSPLGYVKVLGHLVPREHKVEHKVIDGIAEPAALPAPNVRSPEAALAATPEPKPKHKPNRLMMEADTAVGPRERKPRKGSPPGA